MESEGNPFKPNPKERVKKYFPSKPRSHAETRYCSQEINGIDMQKIYAGPNHLHFGDVFVKSEAHQTFWVRNDLRYPIKVELDANHNQELDLTYQKAQIIPPGLQAGFDVVLRSAKLNEEYSAFIKYVINERHSFDMKIEARIVKVSLELESKSLKFNFADDNVEMETFEVLKITNLGNSVGHFSWSTDSKVYRIEPTEGQVEANSSSSVKVYYRPSGVITGKVEEERIMMKILDGEQKTVKCQGQTTEAKCAFLVRDMLQLKDNIGVLDFKQISVCQRQEATIWIKNL